MIIFEPYNTNNLEKETYLDPRFAYFDSTFMYLSGKNKKNASKTSVF